MTHRTPLTKIHYPGPPSCAQCGKRFAPTDQRYRNVWGEVCDDCHADGATLLQPTAPPPPPPFDPLTKPTVRLGPQSGPDGNVFVVIGAVRDAMRAAGKRDQSRVFVQSAHACHTYDDVLALASRYVDLVFAEEQT